MLLLLSMLLVSMKPKCSHSCKWLVDGTAYGGVERSITVKGIHRSGIATHKSSMNCT